MDLPSSDQVCSLMFLRVDLDPSIHQSNRIRPLVLLNTFSAALLVCYEPYTCMLSRFDGKVGYDCVGPCAIRSMHFNEQQTKIYRMKHK